MRLLAGLVGRLFGRDGSPDRPRTRAALPNYRFITAAGRNPACLISTAKDIDLRAASLALSGCLMESVYEVASRGLMSLASSFSVWTILKQPDVRFAELQNVL